MNFRQRFSGIFALLTLGVGISCPPPRPPQTRYAIDVHAESTDGIELAATYVDDADPRANQLDPWIEGGNSPLGQHSVFTHPGFTVCAKAPGYDQNCIPITQAVDQPHTIILKQTVVPVPLRDVSISPYRGCLGNLRDARGWALWGSALSGAPDDVFTDWMRRYRDAGCNNIITGGPEPGPIYPGIVHWDNPDWRSNPAALRAMLDRIIHTPAADGIGFGVTLFSDGGPRNPIPRLQQIFPTFSAAMEGMDDQIIVLPAGWEPVVGAYRSSEVSWALKQWHAYRPHSHIGYHGSPTRLVGSSNCAPVSVDDKNCIPNDPTDLKKGGYDFDDPWKGGESEFYRSSGGEFIEWAFYQTPHDGDGGHPLYKKCDPDQEDGSCWLNRWQDYVTRIGGGFHGWRQLQPGHLVLFETCTYEYTRGLMVNGHIANEQDCSDLARWGKEVADRNGVVVGFGNGFP